jgi:hypothetical protein
MNTCTHLLAAVAVSEISQRACRNEACGKIRMKIMMAASWARRLKSGLLANQLDVDDFVDGFASGA